MARAVLAGFSSYRHDLARLYEAGEDTVVCEGTWRGVNDGPLGMPDGAEIPPTGREVPFRFAIVVSRDAGAEVARSVQSVLRPARVPGDARARAGPRRRLGPDAVW